MRYALLSLSSLLRAVPEASADAITHGVLARCQHLGKEAISDSSEELSIDLRIAATSVIGIIGVTDEALDHMRGPVVALLSCLDNRDRRLQVNPR